MEAIHTVVIPGAMHRNIGLVHVQPLEDLQQRFAI